MWIVVAIVAAVVVGAVTLWGRPQPARIAPPATSAAPSSAPSAPGPAPAALPSVTPTLPPSILVHVAGAVRRPGLYELPSGARVADSIKAAGGPRARSDLDALNLAQPLTDGTKVDVPLRGQQPSVPVPAGVTPSPTLAMVNINAADQAALESLPGVGPVTAAAILEYRSRVGSFSSIDELLEVSGIGPATLEEMRPYVTI